MQLVCADCVRIGASKTCTHGTTELPGWKSASNQRMLDALYKSDPLLGARETQGVIVTGNQFMFAHESIETLSDKALFTFGLRSWPNVLYTSIDPAGGGTMSDFAVMTTAFQNGQNIVSETTNHSNLV